MAGMTNTEIIMNECAMCGFEWDGNNLFTFAEWQNRGMKIIKGSKAIISTTLWKPVSKTNKETGEIENYFIMAKANLFSADQVEPMSEKMKEYISNKPKTTSKKERKTFINVSNIPVIA